MSEVEKDRGNEIAERLIGRDGSVSVEVAVNWIAGLEEKVASLKGDLAKAKSDHDDGLFTIKSLSALVDQLESEVSGRDAMIAELEDKLRSERVGIEETVAVAKQEQSDRIKSLEEDLAAEKRGHAQAVSDAHMARSQLIESRGRIKELRWAMVAFVTKGEGVDVEDDGGRYG